MPKNLTIPKEKFFSRHLKEIRKKKRFRRSDKVCKLKYAEKIKAGILTEQIDKLDKFYCINLHFHSIIFICRQNVFQKVFFNQNQDTLQVYEKRPRIH